jgi:galactokinase
MAIRWQAPGRVNLIGEHTDYNQGFALPFAIEQGSTATVERSDDRSATTVYSVQESRAVEVPDTALVPGSAEVRGWVGYVVGAIWALRERGHLVPPLSIEVDSTVPIGAGLSSSAALVCSVTAAVDDLLELALPPDELLDLTRTVENDFVGAPTGGMDQLAALRCTQDAALFCDMRTLDVEQVPLDLAGHGLAILVIDSQAEHEHASGEYRQRRRGCERAAALLGVDALRDIATDDLDDALDRLPDDELRRYTRHVVTEDERVLEVVRLLRAGDIGAIGPLLTTSHASMRDDYRITIPELDVAVATLLDAGALGARMTGGGFGGCVVALLPTELVAAAAAAVERAYADRGFRSPVAFTTRPSRGAHRVS